MSTARPNKLAAPGEGDAGLLVASLVVVLLGAAIVLLPWLAATLAGVAEPGGPVAWLLRRPWSGQASVALVAMAVLLSVPVVGLTVLLVRSRRGSSPIDDMARFMSSPRDIRGLAAEAVRADTKRLGCEHVGTGIGLGSAVLNGAQLFGTYEFSQTWIMGARAGKTRGVAVRQIVEHHGPVVATSNKPDLHDYCRGPREELGHVWVNDPQGIIGEQPTWWWDMAASVTSVERARDLASLLANSRTAEDTAPLDPFFEPEGQAIAAALLMAASCGGESITRVTDWLTGDKPDPGVPDPVALLNEHGYRAMALRLQQSRGIVHETRSSLYAVAGSLFRWLEDPRYEAWVAPRGEDDQRPCFDPSRFVRSNDTLLLASQEGAGSARAITAALVNALYIAGVEWARVSPGKRCPTPLLFVLDEAANVCRLPELPNWYSHAGGQGIILVTIVQSPAQGHEGWGKGGFGKLVGATNILVVGRGLSDEDYLADLANLIGDYQRRHRSVSSGSKGHRSSSYDVRDERILTVADLRAMPTGRAVLMAAGARPILLEIVDLSRQPWAWKVDGSVAYYGTGEHRHEPTGAAA